MRESGWPIIGRVSILAGLAVGWVALVVLAPWLPVPLAGLVYLTGGGICHQIAERSFHLDGAQLPVCARCMGIAAGAAVGLSALRGLRRMSLRAPRAAASPRGMLLLALALNALTVWGVSNEVRAATGAVLGVAVALALWSALGPARAGGTVDYGRCPSPRRTAFALPDSPRSSVLRPGRCRAPVTSGSDAGARGSSSSSRCR